MMFAYIVIAWNEELNIRDCINSIKALTSSEIYLLDGGSTDKTTAIAAQLGCKVISMPGSSISERRGFALKNIACEYIFFVDADQRLAKKYTEEQLLAHFNSIKNLAGIQLRLEGCPSTVGYWANGFSERLKMITATPGGRSVIGTPCIFNKNLASHIEYEKNLTGPSDDTLYCSRLISAGYQLRAVEQGAYEVVRSSFKGTLKKAFWYGMGDAEYIRYDKENRLKHLYHVYVRGIIIYPMLTFNRKIHLAPFFLIFGVTRGAGLIYSAISKKDLSKTKS